MFLSWTDLSAPPKSEDPNLTSNKTSQPELHTLRLLQKSLRVSLTYFVAATFIQPSKCAPCSFHPARHMFERAATASHTKSQLPYHHHLLHRASQRHKRIVSASNRAFPRDPLSILTILHHELALAFFHACSLSPLSTFKRRSTCTNLSDEYILFLPSIAKYAHTSILAIARLRHHIGINTNNIGPLIDTFPQPFASILAPFQFRLPSSHAIFSHNL